MSIIDRALRIGESKKFKRFEQRVARISDLEPEFEALSDAQLRERFEQYRQRAVNGESLDDLLFETFACTREAGRRALAMRHFDVQLIGGMVLHDGNIAEMKTGEGKTLTATLPVALNALGGQGVHLVTVNDYLAKRDAEWMMPLYDMLGVTVGILQSDDYDHEAKRTAYAADVTYGTNSEFGFDYLRDNLAHSKEERVQQRGQNFAIVDEVDNILIDEARTPLIISGRPEQAADLYKKFAKLAPRMDLGERPPGIDPKNKTWLADYDYERDEKHKTVAITERGVAKAEDFLGVGNLYLAENGALVNHMIQALKAESLYRRDVDYAVIDGEVKIIDEFTGRILDGRRWSEGLHQAVEAKENVRIQEENQTVATITYQNYFRRYNKLAGMTGTALTEATEFMKIYKLQVVGIPTNAVMIRADRNDQIYKTKDGKWAAVVREIRARHELGQPVLVGTISVETSELLGKQLKRADIPHVVLNAKPEHAEREGEIVAQAGRPGSVTIATNMAGRGVDIKLGGNAEQMAELELAKRRVDPADPTYGDQLHALIPTMEDAVKADRDKVLAAGGLFICGTERHESRRIDNQLRGRSGRQGDPGETRFFLSAEDDLVRLFAGDRIFRILDRFDVVDDDGNEAPIEAGILSKQIEGAQKKVEEQNYLQRKRVLEYDDVMNQQREVIYDFRNRILDGSDLRDNVVDQMVGVVERLVEQYTVGDDPQDWDLDQLFVQVDQIMPISFGMSDLDVNGLDRGSLTAMLTEEAREAYEEKEEQLGSEVMRDLERHVLLEIIDERWLEHLNDMDYLREGIHLRGFAEMDPLIAYKNEGYGMFTELMHSIWDQFSQLIFHFELVDEPVAPQRTGPTSLVTGSGSSSTSAGSVSGGSTATKASKPAGHDPDGNPISRNQPCWCGSGKKFKNCHGRNS